METRERTALNGAKRHQIFIASVGVKVYHYVWIGRESPIFLYVPFIVMHKHSQRLKEKPSKEGKSVENVIWIFAYDFVAALMKNAI